MKQTTRTILGSALLVLILLAALAPLDGTTSSGHDFSRAVAGSGGNQLLVLSEAEEQPLRFDGSSSDAPSYSIRAARYATVPKFPLEGLVMGAPKDQQIDIAMVFWVIQGGGHTILFDSGFHREKWFKDFHIVDYVAPDKLVEQMGIAPASVTDVIISHAHWDHMGGIDLFPNATIWIQQREFEYYTGAAWQSGGHNGGIDPEDVLELVRRNTQGKLRLVDGDDVELLPGIRAYTGARHTFASQYIRVAGDPPYVLASDN